MLHLYVAAVLCRIEYIYIFIYINNMYIQENPISCNFNIWIQFPGGELFILYSIFSRMIPVDQNDFHIARDTGSFMPKSKPKQRFVPDLCLWPCLRCFSMHPLLLRTFATLASATTCFATAQNDLRAAQHSSCRTRVQNLHRTSHP